MSSVRSLQFKISASLFLVGVVLISFSAIRLYYRSVQYRAAAVRGLAFDEGSRLSGMAQHLLRRRRSRAADLEMSYISTHPDLQLGVIVDSKGVVRHSTRQQLQGLEMAQTEFGVYAGLVAQVSFSMEGRVFRDADRIIAIFPFWEGSGREKGCVLLAYDLKAPLAYAAATAFRASIAQALVLSGGCLALWLLLKLHVTQRVAGLVAQVRGMSLEGSPSNVISGNDELTHVSRTIRETHLRLQHSEERLRHIAATMRDVFWLAPADANQLPYTNEAYMTLLDRNPADLRTRRWDWLLAIVKEDRRRCLEMLRSLRKGGPAQEVEARVMMDDGGIRWMRCRGFPVIGQTPGKVVAVAGIAMDVSDRKDVERRLLDAAEKERRRIGMDLHDDLCQRLAAALLKTGILQSALTRAGSPQSTLATELAGDLSDATGIARGYARGLAPVGIEALGLTAALSDLAEFISRGFQVPCRVECSVTSENSLAGEAATHVFRVAQELAMNAAKHAKPTWIEISFEDVGDDARLAIAHDGSPYRSEHSNGVGMGMHLVRQRLDALGASISFHPPAADDPHTSVECLIPADRLWNPTPQETT